MATYAKIPVKGGYRWKAIIRISGQSKVCKTFKIKTLAEKWANKREAELREDHGLTRAQRERKLARQTTLFQALEKYRSENSRANIESVKQIDRCLDKWANVRDSVSDRLFGNFNFEEVEDSGRDVIQREVNRIRGKGLSPASVNRPVAHLSRFFKWCVLEGLLIENPCKRVTKIKENPNRIRCLSEEERIALFDACKKSSAEWLYPMVVLACYSGLRRGELLALRWEDVDLSEGTVYVRTSKNGTPRTVPIRDLTVEVLKEFRGNLVYAFGESPLVFGLKTFPSKPWYRALKTSKVENFVFHSLRHTACSYLAMSGVEVLTIKEIAGHKTLAITALYSHLNTKTTSNAVEQMMARHS